MKKQLILFLIIINANSIFSQKSATSDKEKIQIVLKDFMQSIKSKDSTKFYALFHTDPVLWLGTVKEKTYQDDLKRNPKAKDYFKSNYKSFFKSIADKNKYEEKFYNIQITEDGNIAVVNFDYSFWENDVKINWGKESWGLIKTQNQWKICSVLFSVEYEKFNPEIISNK